MLEFAVTTCTECQENQRLPAKAPMHPWEWPDRPWARIHIDYAGPVKGKMILVIVDSHSKWIEAQVVNAATLQATIEKLRLVFSTHGLPEVIVSDNGTSFTSEEFAGFIRSNGIRHLMSAPYHPASNGLAKRAVQILKNALKKDPGGVSLETKLLVFSFTTGSPFIPLLVLHLLNCSWDGDHDLVSTFYTLTLIADRVRKRQFDQKHNHDQHYQQRQLSAGQIVWVRNHATGQTWLPGGDYFRSP